ncbi:unnamed protein product, partial [Discosporangium mesarthrocarpum]
MDIRSFFQPKQGGGSSVKAMGDIKNKETDKGDPKEGKAKKTPSKPPNKKGERKYLEHKGLGKSITEGDPAKPKSGTEQLSDEDSVEVLDISIKSPENGAKRKAGSITRPSRQSPARASKKHAGRKGNKGDRDVVDVDQLDDDRDDDYEDEGDDDDDGDDYDEDFEEERFSRKRKGDRAIAAASKSSEGKEPKKPRKRAKEDKEDNHGACGPGEGSTSRHFAEEGGGSGGSDNIVKGKWKGKGSPKSDRRASGGNNDRTSSPATP